MNQSARSSSRWPFLAVILIVGVFVAYVSHVKHQSGESPTSVPIQPVPSPANAPAAGGTNGSSSSVLPGPGTFYPSQGHDHWDETKLKAFVYNSNPPTSGPHEEVFADGYISTVPLAKAIQVHLLEHGSVLIQYNCTCPDLVRKLTALAQSFDTYNPQMAMETGKAVLIAPNPEIRGKIALTAWTRLQVLDRYDEARIKQFITAWLGNEKNARQ